MLNKVLIVDDSPAIREILTMYVESFCEPEIIVADSGNTALMILEQSSPVDLVISDFNMPNGTGGELYNSIRTQYPKLPFILQTAEPLELLDEFRHFPNDTYEGFLQKPFSLDEVEELLERISTSTKQINSENILLVNEEYKRISIETFLKYMRVGVDVFIKIGQKKYVRLFRGDDELDHQVIDQYKKKGVDYFYISEKDFKLFIEACSEELMNKLMSPNLSEEEVAKLKFTTSDQLMESLEQLGVDPIILEQTQKITESIVSSIPSKSELAALLKELDRDYYLGQLAQLTANIAVALVDKISWGDSHIKKKLATAAFFMDCSLLNSHKGGGQGVDCVNLSLASNPQQVKIHPKNSADLYDMLDVDSDVFNLIVDHHERPGGRGFPRQVDSDNISSLAAVFILAHEFSHQLIIQEKLNLTIFSKIKTNILSRFNEGKYREALKAFSSIFC